MSILTVEYPKTDEQLAVPDWDRYRKGVAGQPFRASTSRYGGGVDFGSHIGKPLSDRLWRDLVFRLQPVVLEVRRANEEEKPIGRGGNYVKIYVEPDGITVQTIIYSP
jgi:hypothetical protein